MGIRVHVNDPLDKEAMELLRSKEELEVTSEHLDREELMKVIPEVDVLIVRSATKVTGDIIEMGKKLKIIARAGVGLDNIDVRKARDLGIKVLNTPGASAISVAELAIGMMFALSRHLVRGTVDLKEGRWTKKELKGVELFGKTLGIVGIGRIGREVAKRALALGMKVLAYDPYIKEVEMEVEMVDFKTLLSRSDYITFHVPLTEETRHMVNEETISKMKDGVFLINCSRGGILDEKAVLDGLKSGKIAGLGLDVFENEPPNTDVERELLSLNNVVATPHIGASTKEAQKRVGKEIVQKVFEELGVV